MIPNGIAAIRRFFGDPSKNRAQWERTNLVRVPLPFAMTLAWAPGTKVDHVLLHKNAAEDFARRMTEVWQHARIEMKKIHGYEQSTKFYDHKALEWLHAQGLTLFGGAYNYRKKRGGSSLSVHSYGGAWDIDPTHNAMGTKGRIPLWYVNIWTRPDANGDHWIWGGKFKNPDPMHFQFCKGY